MRRIAKRVRGPLVSTATYVAFRIAQYSATAVCGGLGWFITTNHTDTHLVLSCVNWLSWGGAVTAVADAALGYQLSDIATMRPRFALRCLGIVALVLAAGFGIAWTIIVWNPFGLVRLIAWAIFLVAGGVTARVLNIYESNGTEAGNRPQGPQRTRGGGW